MLADNLITAQEIGLLDRMAEDLGLGDAEKKKVVRQLSSQYPGLFTGTLDDGLRLLGYRGELERSISDNRGILPDKAALLSLQARFRIQPDEHEGVLRELRDPNSSRTLHLRREVEEHQALREDLSVLSAESAPAIRFLHHELSVRLADERDHLLEIANLYGSAGELTDLAPSVRQRDPAAILKAVQWIHAHLPNTVADQVANVVEIPPETRMERPGPDSLTQILLRWSEEGDNAVRAAAVYALSAGQTGSEATQVAARGRAQSYLTHSDPLLREAAVAALAPNLSEEQWEKAMSDPSKSVRRGAIQRVPLPLTPEILPWIRKACSDSDSVISVSARLMIENPDAAADARQAQETLTVLEKMFAVRSLRLLANIPSDALRQLAENAEERLFCLGELLCIQGDSSDDVYLVLAGEAEAVRGSGESEVRIGLIHPGETVGEMGILDPAPRMATVRAISPIVRVLTVHGSDFRALLARDAAASIGIIRLLIQRQRDLTK